MNPLRIYISTTQRKDLAGCPIQLYIVFKAANRRDAAISQLYTETPPPMERIDEEKMMLKLLRSAYAPQPKKWWLRLMWWASEELRRYVERGC